MLYHVYARALRAALQRHALARRCCSRNRCNDKRLIALSSPPGSCPCACSLISKEMSAFKVVLLVFLFPVAARSTPHDPCRHEEAMHHVVQSVGRQPGAISTTSVTATMHLAIVAVCTLSRVSGRAPALHIGKGKICLLTPDTVSVTVSQSTQLPQLDPTRALCRLLVMGAARTSRPPPAQTRSHKLHISSPAASRLPRGRHCRPARLRRVEILHGASWTFLSRCARCRLVMP